MTSPTDFNLSSVTPVDTAVEQPAVDTAVAENTAPAPEPAPEPVVAQDAPASSKSAESLLPEGATFD